MKRIILWNYSRGTWQYDVFCLLIVAFIFLTPKTWFDNGEKIATQTANLHVKAQDFSLSSSFPENENGLRVVKKTESADERLSPGEREYPKIELDEPQG